MWTLRRVQVLGEGFLAGLDIEFPTGLTCIIGPRGSGKTTFFEAIRYALACDHDASKAKSSLVRDNLGSSVVLVDTVSGRQEAYRVSRGYPNAPTVTNASGVAIEGVSLERGTFLPLDAFSSREIEDIADESLGSKRRSLLDSLKDRELHEISLKLNDHRRALDANAERIAAARRQIAELTEQAEELKESPARLAAMPPPAPGDESTKLAASARQQSLSQQDLARLRDSWNTAEALRGRLNDFSDELRGIRIEVEMDSANAAHMMSARDNSDEALRDLDSLLRFIQERLVRFQDAVTATGKAVRASSELQSAAHAELMQRNAALGLAIQQRTKAEQDVAKLTQVIARAEEAKKGLEELLLKRRELKAAYVLERDKVCELRTEVAAQLSADCGPSVRVRVQRHGDDQAHRQQLLKALAGSGLRGQDQVVSALARMRPEQLAGLILENDLEELEQATQLGAERCRKVMDSLRENIDVMAMEITPIDDRVSIELNVGTEREPNFRDAAELSRGQKCTALLPLLLARRSVPLLIDQPEDNLDNHFIFETVVDAIGRLKSRRQLVFITHNANIPVLGEADLVIVMDSDGKRGFVKKAGTLDQCRGEIVDLLEGGEEAFDKRRRRYGRD